MRPDEISIVVNWAAVQEYRGISEPVRSQHGQDCARLCAWQQRRKRLHRINGFNVTGYSFCSSSSSTPSICNWSCKTHRADVLSTVPNGDRGPTRSQTASSPPTCRSSWPGIVYVASRSHPPRRHAPALSRQPSTRPPETLVHLSCVRRIISGQASALEEPMRRIAPRARLPRILPAMNFAV